MSKLTVFGAVCLPLALTAGDDQAVVAAVTGQDIHVLGLFGTMTGAVRLHAAGDDSGGVADYPTADGTATRVAFPVVDSEFAYLTVPAGTALQMDVAATRVFNGCLVYRLVPTAAGQP